MDKGLVEFAKWYEKSKEPTDPAGARCSQWKKDQSAT
jgi:hypothetical protein